MSMLVPVSEAKGRLTELVRDAESEDIVIVRHGRPAAVLIGSERFDALLEDLEDLRDRLSIHEREGVTIGLDKLDAEIGHNL